MISDISYHVVGMMLTRDLQVITHKKESSSSLYFLIEIEFSN